MTTLTELTTISTATRIADHGQGIEALFQTGSCRQERQDETQSIAELVASSDHKATETRVRMLQIQLRLAKHPHSFRKMGLKFLIDNSESTY